jgi:hypothetical protein
VAAGFALSGQGPFRTPSGSLGLALASIRDQAPLGPWHDSLDPAYPAAVMAIGEEALFLACDSHLLAADGSGCPLHSPSINAMQAARIFDEHDVKMGEAISFSRSLMQALALFAEMEPSAGAPLHPSRDPEIPLPALFPLTTAGLHVNSRGRQRVIRYRIRTRIADMNTVAHNIAAKAARLTPTTVAACATCGVLSLRHSLARSRARPSIVIRSYAAWVPRR